MQSTNPPDSRKAICVKCGYVLDAPNLESRCPECGEPVRHSADRFRVKSKISGDASRAMVVGFLSIVPLPILAPYAIYLGARSLRTASVHRAGSLASLMSIGAIVLGLLGFVSLYVLCDIILTMTFGW